MRSQSRPLHLCSSTETVELIPLACRGFKALKQVVKIHYKMGNVDAMLEAYRSAGAQGASRGCRASDLPAVLSRLLPAGTC